MGPLALVTVLPLVPLQLLSVLLLLLMVCRSLSHHSCCYCSAASEYIRSRGSQSISFIGMGSANPCPYSYSYSRIETMEVRR